MEIDMFAMKQIATAIKALDSFRVHEIYVGTQDNVKRINEARINLINVLFSSGYELQCGTYKLVKSKEKRKLILP